MALIEGHDDVLAEALCWHEAFRRLGYPSEDIFIGIKPLNDCVEILVVGKWGDRTFQVKAGTTELDPEMVMPLWTKAVEWWNTAPVEMNEVVWSRSMASKHVGGFLAEMAKVLMVRQQPQFATVH